MRVRAKASVMTSKHPPARTDAGTRMRWSGPMMIRMMCGTTNPTNPITPEKDTAAATTMEVTTIIISITR